MLTREDLEHAFGDLGRMAWLAGKLVEIAVYGGSAMILTIEEIFAPASDAPALPRKDRAP